ANTVLSGTLSAAATDVTTLTASGLIKTTVDAEFSYDSDSTANTGLRLRRNGVGAMFLAVQGTSTVMIIEESTAFILRQNTLANLEGATPRTGSAAIWSCTSTDTVGNGGVGNVINTGALTVAGVTTLESTSVIEGIMTFDPGIDLTFGGSEGTLRGDGTDLLLFGDDSASDLLITDFQEIRLGSTANYTQVDIGGDQTFVGTAGFYPRRISQADAPASGVGATQVDVGEMIIWRDSTTGEIHLVYNDTTAGVSINEFTGED
ncbi:hypothetical protein LCGC14_2509780, partial [marine sediment metagenome]